MKKGYCSNCMISDNIVNVPQEQCQCECHKRKLLDRIKTRWTQYQWENEHQPHIDPKSIAIALGFILVVIGGLIWI